MDDSRQPEVEWVAELGSGQFRSRSHVVNHMDMIFGCGKRYEEDHSIDDRFALIRVDEEPQWRVFGGFDEASERKRARDHVLAHAGDPDSWEQIEIAWESDASGEPDWDAETPELTWDDAVRAVNDAVRMWAALEKEDLGEFMEKSACFVLLADWRPAVLNRVKVRSFGVSDAPLKRNDRAMMAAEHGDSAAWRAFAIHACKSDQVKAELMRRQEGKCAACGGELAAGVVHHVDYDHECELALSGDPWTAPGARVRPDCARCMSEKPEFAERCLSRLRLVHSRCNRKVEQY